MLRQKSLKGEVVKLISIVRMNSLDNGMKLSRNHLKKYSESKKSVGLGGK